MDGPKDQKRSIREGDSLNVRFVILYTGYYTRDDRNFSCFSFNRRVTLRYLKIRISRSNFFFFFFFLSFSRNLHREYIDFDPSRCKQSINTSVIRAQTRIELAKDGARERISDRGPRVHICQPDTIFKQEEQT